MPTWLFVATLALILGVTALETYIHWPTISDAEAAGSFWRKLWLAASKKGFQTTLTITLLWLPFGLAIEKLKEVFMRFLNRDATLEKAKESGRAERDLEWTAYTERMKAALERGEPFNEPPPSRSPRR